LKRSRHPLANGPAASDRFLQLDPPNTLKHSLLVVLTAVLFAACGPSFESRPQVSETPTRTPPAANADVLFVRAVQDERGTWTFHVTVEHPDTGWEDYADGWNVVTSDGEILKANPDHAFTRALMHPHVQEQPFTRSQPGLTIPESVQTLTVRAHDGLHGFGGREVVLDMSTRDGEGYEILRNEP
jgi:hypothetical protein